MGVQASMWTEFCNKPEDVEYQLFPRLAALAEVAWTQPWHKNWRSFLVAMDKFNEHLSAKGRASPGLCRTSADFLQAPDRPARRG